MHPDGQTIAGFPEPFTKAFCVEYYEGNVFAVGTAVGGVVMLVTIESLCIVDITGGSHLSWIFWEHENLSGLSVIWLTSTYLH